MEQFKQSEEIFKKLDEQDQEQEMLDQREVLAKLLGVKLTNDQKVIPTEKATD